MYREAASLKTLRAEIDAYAPDRSTASDGWIGDEAHATRDSDHNPWVIDAQGIGVVRARDITHDPAGGMDCHWLATRLASQLRRLPALRSGAYLIWNRRIISADRLDEGWRTYTGTNPHDKHLHVSVALAPDDYDDTTTWGIQEEDGMALSDDDKEWIAAQIKAAAAQAAREVMAYRVVPRKDITVRQVLRELLNSDAPRTSVRAPAPQPAAKGSRVRDRKETTP